MSCSDNSLVCSIYTPNNFPARSWVVRQKTARLMWWACVPKRALRTRELFMWNNRRPRADGLCQLKKHTAPFFPTWRFSLCPANRTIISSSINIRCDSVPAGFVACQTLAVNCLFLVNWHLCVHVCNIRSSTRRTNYILLFAFAITLFLCTFSSIFNGVNQTEVKGFIIN